MPNCGNPGKWTITYQLSPDNASPWEARTLTNISGFSGDAPYLATKTQSGCARANDIKSGCDGRVMVATITCNSYIRNVGYTFIPDVIYYDCINGACFPKTTYNTPGIYPSLAECQAQCGGSKCNGVCVNNSDWAQIQGLSNQIRNKNCN